MSANSAARARLAPSAPVAAAKPGAPGIVIRELGRADYVATLEAMKRFTAQRDAATPDELWLVEHPPVYTYGLAGRAEHLPAADAGIPCIKVDRGGQVTYHGPGQVVVYTLVDLRRRNLSVRAMVDLLEQAAIDVLARLAIHGARRAGAPGVYVGDAKIAALGLKVKNGCCYHGLSFNVDADLAPFSAIDPCGYPGLRVTRLRDLGVHADCAQIGALLAERIAALLRGD